MSTAPSIPFMTASSLPATADKYTIQARERLGQLMLIELVSQARRAAIMPEYLKWEEAAQAVGFGANEPAVAEFRKAYDAERFEGDIQAQVGADRIQVNKWLANAAIDDRLGKLKPFPTMDGDLTAYLDTIKL